MLKYQLSRVNSYFSIEKNAIPDLSQVVSKNEEFWISEMPMEGVGSIVCLLPLVLLTSPPCGLKEAFLSQVRLVEERFKVFYFRTAGSSLFGSVKNRVDHF